MSENNGLISIEIDTTTALRQLSLKLQDIEAPDCMQEVADDMKNYFNQFVPMGGEDDPHRGDLRKSCEATGAWKTSTLTWGKGLKYAHYQYAGVVYEPNIPVFKDGVFIGRWVSPKGKTKTPTERKLGQGFVDVESGLRSGGYSTPGTSSNWVAVGKRDPSYHKLRASIVRRIQKRWDSARKEYYG